MNNFNFNAYNLYVALKMFGKNLRKLYINILRKNFKYFQYSLFYLWHLKIDFNYKILQKISNFVFILLPPLLIYFFRDYAKYVTYGIHVILFMLIVVGTGSIYFHATLTMVL